MNTAQYIQKVADLYHAGNATEYSYRGDLQHYLEALLPDIKATNEPKRQQCGAPDYIITKTARGNAIPVGYIEAKNLGEVKLDDVETKTSKREFEQFQRYTASLENLIYTDYLEFRFFKNAEKVATVAIGKVEGGKVIPLPENFAALETLLQDFIAFQGQTITSSKKLADMMAGKARLMRDVFHKAVIAEEDSGLKDQLKAFQQILIHDMDAEQFADIYAQTITYGLFTARLHDPTPETFSRAESYELMPKSNPFLRSLFLYVAQDLDDNVKWVVDALCDVFRATNVHDILTQFGKTTGRNDPIIHFYEDFLKAYDAGTRKDRGVWYTPEAVVNFIIRAMDECLVKHFGLKDGLADTSKVKIEVESQEKDKRTKTGKKIEEREVHKVQLLDVATGTGTFIAEVIKQVYDRVGVGQAGMWSSYVDEHLLPRLHGFEILMASYAMCHMKIDLLLNETGYKTKKPANPPRLSVYLTNSLEEHHPDVDTLFAGWLSREANEASYIKRDIPVMVAFGNPPYSGHSMNKTALSDKLLEDYKQEPTGGKLKEKNSKWLNDDYVKFLRLGEHYVEKNGEGILAYITNHGYLDNPTFRGMRWHLLNTFDDIYIIDLHGNAKKKEIAPDGGKDENVFAIQQGVAIIVAVKHSRRAEELAQVHHLDMWGKRKKKFKQLYEHSLEALDFSKLTPSAPFYLFSPRDSKKEGVYYQYISLRDIFPLNNTGLITKRDKLTIDFSRKELWKKVNNFAEFEEGLSRQIFKLPKDVRDWKYQWARKDIVDSGPTAERIIRLAYRPFDYRFTYYTGNSRGFVGWPIPRITEHFFNHKNIGLVSARSNKSGRPDHFFMVNSVSETKCGEASTQSCIFPLYLYPTADEQLSLEGDASTSRQPNLDAGIVQAIAKKLKLPFVPDHEDKAADGKTAFSPLDLLDYIYAVLHSPTYRETYKEFLKIDFPRVPYPKDAATFWKLVELGSELRQLHLLEALPKPSTTFPEAGGNTVDTINKKSYVNGKVYINKTQYFAGVPEVAWNFYIGGYQPAQKWLKDRKGRELLHDDLRHYQNIIIALTETDRLMKEIDAVGVV